MHTMEDEKDEERCQNLKMEESIIEKRNVSGMPTTFSPLSQMYWNFSSAEAWDEVFLYGHYIWRLHKSITLYTHLIVSGRNMVQELKQLHMTQCQDEVRAYSAGTHILKVVKWG